MHRHESNPMPEHRNHTRTNGRSAGERQCKLMLVGCGQKSEDGWACAALGSEYVRTTNLLEALAHLPSTNPDLVLLGPEFSDEEQALFLLEARRRGFLGAILHIVAVPLRSAPSLPPTGAEAEAERLTFRSTSFTPKEQAVLRGVANARSNREIAQDLQCSVGSVKAAIRQLFEKLGVRKRTQIVRMALQSGFRPAP
jgi:DNA-binding CsgD family transcriptional regulator